MPFNRYQRQTLLPELGYQGQQLLAGAKVLVVGAGGLGCPVIQYLAAAGIGYLGIADADTVELTNLNRQTLYTPNQVGLPKATLAAQWVQRFNPLITSADYCHAITRHNVLNILHDYHLIIDATDNFATRYLLNDACVIAGKPLVYGAVYRFQGQVAVFNLPLPNGTRSANYRHLYPTPPLPNQAPNCTQNGILGVLPGLIGTLQATEALKIITQIGQPLANKILYYNTLNHQYYTIAYQPDAQLTTNAPQTEQELLHFDYDLFCHNSPVAEVRTLSGVEWVQYLHQPKTLFIDVRNANEEPAITGFYHLRLPLPQIPRHLPPLQDYNTIILFCQTGTRSLIAAQQISAVYPHLSVYSLQGGIATINQFNQ